MADQHPGAVDRLLERKAVQRVGGAGGGGDAAKVLGRQPDRPIIAPDCIMQQGLAAQIARRRQPRGNLRGADWEQAVGGQDQRLGGFCLPAGWTGIEKNR